MTSQNVTSLFDIFCQFFRQNNLAPVLGSLFDFGKEMLNTLRYASITENATPKMISWSGVLAFPW